MESSLIKLPPQTLWKHFDEIRKIPRCSKKEEKIREYVINFAKKQNLSFNVDKIGNVVIRRASSKGKEKCSGVILQAHMDMVCEKNEDVKHDFEKDPIKIEIEGEWVKAVGTSLGADNGIGVAACLAILEEENLINPPLEILLTVDEETGLTGARGLEKSFIKGRRLLNLDTEDEGVFIIGCAGGADTEFFIPITRKKERFKNFYVLKIKGLKGGHSGLDIHLERGNAIKIITRILYNIKEEIELVSIDGGNKRNAIPRECKAVFASNNEVKIKERLGRIEKEIREELSVKDPGIKIELEEVSFDFLPMVKEDKERILRFLLLLPHGVVSRDPHMIDFVQTSTNLALIKTEDRRVHIVENSRSSVNSELEYVKNILKAAGEIIGASVKQPPGYPGWRPNPDSLLLKKAVKVYKNTFGKEPKVKAVHAGLETAIIGERFPGMDMISFGPTIKHPHSPEEVVNIPSVEKFYKFLKEFLKEL